MNEFLSFNVSLSHDKLNVQTTSNKNLIYRFYVQNHMIFFSLSHVIMCVFVATDGGGAYQMFVEKNGSQICSVDLDNIFVTRLHSIQSKIYNYLHMLILAFPLIHINILVTFLWQFNPYHTYVSRDIIFCVRLCLLQKRNLKLMEYCFSTACVTFFAFSCH